MTTNAKILGDIKEKLGGRIGLYEFDILNRISSVITDEDKEKDTLKTIASIIDRADEGSIKFIADTRNNYNGHIFDENQESEISIEWTENDDFLKSYNHAIRNAESTRGWLTWILQAEEAGIVSQNYIINNIEDPFRITESDRKYETTNDGKEYGVSVKYVGVFNKDGFYAFNKVKSFTQDATTFKEIIK